MGELRTWLNERRPAGLHRVAGDFVSAGRPGNWSNGYLPASFQGTPLRAKGSPILGLTPPPGVTAERQRVNLDLLAKLNAAHAAQHPGHDELAARMDNYELAFRMQAQVPETLDLSKEDVKTKELYGIAKTPRMPLVKMPARP